LILCITVDPISSHDRTITLLEEELNGPVVQRPQIFAASNETLGFVFPIQKGRRSDLA